MLRTAWILLALCAVAAQPGISEDRVAQARVRHGETIRAKFKQAGVPYPGRVLLIRVFKAEALLELWAAGETGEFKKVSEYPILASSGSPGPKRREGDRQVPEGFYEVRVFNPKSLFHLSLGLNYPNASDLVRSDKAHPGSDIYLHGKDVTIGCMPIGDDAIEEVYLAALDCRDLERGKTEVQIFPCVMRGEGWNEFRESHPELREFWAELQPGFDWFEDRRRLPNVRVREDGAYVVGR